MQIFHVQVRRQQTSSQASARTLLSCITKEIARFCPLPTPRATIRHQLLVQARPDGPRRSFRPPSPVPSSASFQCRGAQALPLGTLLYVKDIGIAVLIQMAKGKWMHVGHPDLEQVTHTARIAHTTYETSRGSASAQELKAGCVLPRPNGTFRQVSAGQVPRSVHCVLEIPDERK